MKKIVLVILFLSGFVTSYSQVASRLLAGQAIPKDTSVGNYLYVDTTSGGMLRIWTATWSSVRLVYANTPFFSDSTQSIGDRRYVRTEVDPIFIVSPAAGITSTNISNWNTAYGWGNHASAGYATATNTMTFSNKSGNISQWTNNSNYYVTPNGTTAQYVRGDGSLATSPVLATVATTGLYNDLIGKPTIPAAQIQSDWNQVNTGALDYIKNKPTIPTVKRVETYVGTTDGSGNYTVTYSTPFSTIPDVQPQLQGGTVNQQVRITSSSTTGFTVQATQRAVLSVLGLDVLAGTATALTSASVGVLVTAR